MLEEKETGLQIKHNRTSCELTSAEAGDEHMCVWGRGNQSLHSFVYAKTFGEVMDFQEVPGKYTRMSKLLSPVLTAYTTLV